MNIYTVRDNLYNTILGKQELLNSSKSKLIQWPPLDDVAWFVTKTQVEFLELNLVELNKILADVELCCTKATEEQNG